MRDDETAFSFNDCDIRIIELGIMHAQLNKYETDPHGSINSFKFYTNEIASFERLGLSGDIIEMMVKVNRQRWQQIINREIDLSFLEETA